MLVMPSLWEGAAFVNLLSATTGTAPIVVCALVGVIAVAALAWATGRLVGARQMWLQVVYALTVAAVVMGTRWWGLTRNTEHELMRAQVLRRLGHSAIADRIESPLMNPVGPSEE